MPNNFTYPHLYLGAKVLTPEGVGTFTEIDIWAKSCMVNFADDDPDCGHSFRLNEIQLILRPLTDATEEDIMDWYKLACELIGDTPIALTNEQVKIAVDTLRSKGFGAVSYDIDDSEQVGLVPHLFNFLLSRHFDLFNLIPSGIALDATQMETNPYNETL